jgi:flagellar biosynthesis/type III secretory pathway protein FliH
MNSVVRGRIVRGDAAASARPVLAPGPSRRQRARLSREQAEAHRDADRVIDLALTQSRTILDAARDESRKAAAEAAREVEEKEQARLAAAWLALRAREEIRAESDLGRSIALARVLAERLLGRAIELDPALIQSIAREVLTELRGARRVRIEAHPLDADELRAHLAGAGLWAPLWAPEAAPEAGPESAAATIVSSTDLARGSLIVHTDVGTLDAQLHPRLERLASALRDAIDPA